MSGTRLSCFGVWGWWAQGQSDDGALAPATRATTPWSARAHTAPFTLCPSQRARGIGAMPCDMPGGTWVGTGAVPEPAGAHRSGRTAWARAPAHTTALCPVAAPASKQLWQEIFSAAGKINSVGAVGCFPQLGTGGQRGGQGTATTTGPRSSPAAQCCSCSTTHESSSLGPPALGLWKEMSPCAEHGWVICHPHPTQQSWGTLGTVRGSDAAVTPGCQGQWGCCQALVGGGGPTWGTPQHLWPRSDSASRFPPCRRS